MCVRVRGSRPGVSVRLQSYDDIGSITTYRVAAVIGLVLYHIADCGRLLALCLCLSVCQCVLAITAPHSNAKSQIQLNVSLLVTLSAL